MGGLTTFSTAMAESVRLGRFGERAAAWGYTAGTLIGSLVLAWIGLTISGGR
jgi:fluoride ion exporter CrcB/FEX